MIDILRWIINSIPPSFRTNFTFSGGWAEIVIYGLQISAWSITGIDGCLSRSEIHRAIVAVVEPAAWLVEHFGGFISVIQDRALVTEGHTNTSL